MARSVEAIVKQRNALLALVEAQNLVKRPSLSLSKRTPMGRTVAAVLPMLPPNRTWATHGKSHAIGRDPMQARRAG